MIYTGIGSRQTPPDILLRMAALGESLAEQGHTLRSGGAPGADSAFQCGARRLDGPREIYIPWPGFGAPDPMSILPTDAQMIAAATMLASHGIGTHILHGDIPALFRLRGPGTGAPRLFARNAFQVLGLNLSTPSSRVYCWTPGGAVVGGTAIAIRLAQIHNIPVINLAV